MASPPLTYNRTIRDVLDLQGRIAAAIAGEVAPLAALASWYGATGDPGHSDAAIEKLERLDRQGPGGLQQLRNDPRFDGLRSDRRFMTLLRRKQ